MVKRFNFPHLISLFFTAAMSLPALSAPVRDESSLRQKAETETRPQPVAPGSLPPEQSGMVLQLEDPYQPLTSRASRWTLGAQILNQSQAPEIGLNFGYLSAANEASLQWGAEAELALSSKKISSEARLNSTRTEARGYFRGPITESKRWHWKSGLGLGRMAEIQSSDDPSLRYTDQRTYASLFGGADWAISRTWLLQTTLRFPTIASPQLGLGVQTVW